MNPYNNKPFTFRPNNKRSFRAVSNTGVSEVETTTVTKRARPKAQAMAVIPIPKGPFRSGGWGQNELNFNDVVYNTAPTVVASSLRLLNGLQVGAAANQRVGRKITIKSVQIRGEMQHRYDWDTDNAANQDNAGFIGRLVLVWDRQPNKVAPIITDVMVSASGISLTNLDNRNRFQILWDKCWGSPNTFALAPSTHATTTNKQVSGGAICFKKYKKLNLTTIYNSGNVGDITDINTGALYLVAMSTANNTNAPAEVCNFDLSCRIRFIE